MTGLDPVDRRAAAVRKRKAIVAAMAACVLVFGAGASRASANEVADEHGSVSPNPFAGSAFLEREALVDAVLARNPSVEAMRAAWQAAEARPAQAGALEDPTVAYTFAPLSIDDADVRYGQVIDFSQRFPFPGKRSLRAAVEAAEARAQQGEYAAVEREVALMASLLFDDYWATERSLEINDEHDRLLNDLMGSAKARYTAGQVPQYALIGVEIELAHIHHSHIVLETQRRVTIAQLNALLHRAATAPLPPPARDLRIAARSVASSETLITEAIENRPEIAAAGARVEAAGDATALARREYLPDFGIGATYNGMWDRPEHRVMTGVSINVPLQLGRRHAAVDEAEAELLRRRSERAAVIDRVSTEVETARLRLLEAQHVTSLYRDRIVPASNDRAASVRAAFETGEAGLDDLIEAERDARNATLARQLSSADVSRRQAELDRTLGRIAGTSHGVDNR